MNELRFSWLVLRQEAPASLMERFLMLCEDLLPEAVPTKFGTDDPPRDTYSLQNFLASSEQRDLGWTAARPFGYGSMSNLAVMSAPSEHRLAGTLEPTAVGAISVSCATDFLEEAANIDRVRAFFIAVAEACESFLAVIEVERDAKWARSYLDAKLTNPSLLNGRRFRGLPIGDVWLAHFGPRYRELLSAEVSLRPTGRGAVLEVDGGWQGLERVDGGSLIGRVPERFLSYTVDRTREIGRTEIRAGVRVHPADNIPSVFDPAAGSYRAQLWTTEAVDREALVASMAKAGLSVELASNDYLTARSGSWHVRLRSATAEGSLLGVLPQLFSGRREVPAGYELAPSIDDYSEVWEVTGEIDLAGHFSNDWLGVLESLGAQGKHPVWVDLGPV